MNLSDSDQRDLFGRVARLGTDEADARADELVASNADARASHEQATRLRDGLESMAADQQQHVLSPEQVRHNANDILRRAEVRRFATSVNMRIRPAIALLGFAASCALVFTLPRMLGHEPHMDLSAAAGTLAIEVGSAVSPIPAFSQAVPFGEEITITDPEALLQLKTGSRVLFKRDARFRINARFVIEMLEGYCYVNARGGAVVEANDLTIRCSDGLFALAIGEEGVTCSVYEGSVVVKRGDIEHTVSAEESVLVTSEAGDVRRDARRILLSHHNRRMLTE